MTWFWHGWIKFLAAVLLLVAIALFLLAEPLSHFYKESGSDEMAGLGQGVAWLFLRGIAGVCACVGLTLLCLNWILRWWNNRTIFAIAPIGLVFIVFGISIDSFEGLMISVAAGIYLIAVGMLLAIRRSQLQVDRS